MRLHSSAFALVAATLCLGAACPASAATIVPLGNLFDDPKLTPLATAIGTDTTGATADPNPVTGDLGVETVLTSTGSAEVIAPGIVFNFTSAGGGTAGSFNLVYNDTAYSTNSAIRTTGVSMPVFTPPVIEGGIGMAANHVLTFDLDEIRLAGALGAAPFTFTAEGGLNDDAIGVNTPGTSAIARMAVIVSDATGVVAGYLNGTQVAVGQTAGVWSFTGGIPAAFDGNSAGPYTALFNVPVSGDAMWLTLVSLQANGTIDSDQTVFSEAQLTVVEASAIPEPASFVLLGAGVLGMIARRRRG